MNYKLNATKFDLLKNRKTTKTFIVLAIFLLGLSSCSVTKCRYSSGFKIDLNITSKDKPTEMKAKKALKKENKILNLDTICCTLKEIAHVEQNSISNSVLNINKNTNDFNFNNKKEKSKQLIKENKKMENSFANDIQEIQINKQKTVIKNTLNKDSSQGNTFEDSIIGYVLVLLLIMTILIITGAMPYIIAFFTSDSFVLIMQLLGLLLCLILGWSIDSML